MARFQLADSHELALTIWPPTGKPLYPFLSSVDNGWLATALMMVANAMPQLRTSTQEG